MTFKLDDVTTPGEACADDEKSVSVELQHQPSPVHDDSSYGAHCHSDVSGRKTVGSDGEHQIEGGAVKEEVMHVAEEVRDHQDVGSVPAESSLDCEVVSESIAGCSPDLYSEIKRRRSMKSSGKLRKKKFPVEDGTSERDSNFVQETPPVCNVDHCHESEVKVDPAALSQERQEFRNESFGAVSCIPDSQFLLSQGDPDVKPNPRKTRARRRCSEANVLDFSYLDENDEDMYSQIKTRRRRRGMYTENSDVLASQSQQSPMDECALEMPKVSLGLSQGKAIPNTPQESSLMDQRKEKRAIRRRRTFPVSEHSPKMSLSCPLQEIKEKLLNSPVVYFSLPDKEFGHLKMAKLMRTYTASSKESKSGPLSGNDCASEDGFIEDSQDVFKENLRKRRLTSRGRRNRGKRKLKIDSATVSPPISPLSLRVAETPDEILPSHQTDDESKSENHTILPSQLDLCEQICPNKQEPLENVVPSTCVIHPDIEDGDCEDAKASLVLNSSQVKDEPEDEGRQSGNISVCGQKSSSSCERPQNAADIATNACDVNSLSKTEASDDTEDPRVGITPEEPRYFLIFVLAPANINSAHLIG